MPDESNDEKRRLAGGPPVPGYVCDWYEAEAARVAKAEHLAKASIALLHVRVAELQPDLTQEGINRARNGQKKKPKARRN